FDWAWPSGCCAGDTDTALVLKVVNCCTIDLNVNIAPEGAISRNRGANPEPIQLWSLQRIRFKRFKIHTSALLVIGKDII
ncbi:MAG: hypothetical protein PVJ68_06250, partial [Candidatus Thiodiazotropha sp.]